MNSNGAARDAVVPLGPLAIEVSGANARRRAESERLPNRAHDRPLRRPRREPVHQRLERARPDPAEPHSVSHTPWKTSGTQPPASSACITTFWTAASVISPLPNAGVRTMKGSSGGSDSARGRAAAGAPARRHDPADAASCLVAAVAHDRLRQRIAPAARVGEAHRVVAARDQVLAVLAHLPALLSLGHVGVRQAHVRKRAPSDLVAVRGELVHLRPGHVEVARPDPLAVDEERPLHPAARKQEFHLSLGLRRLAPSNVSETTVSARAGWQSPPIAKRAKADRESRIHAGWACRPGMRPS